MTYASRPLDSFMFAADCDGRSGDHSFGTKDGGRRRTIIGLLRDGFGDDIGSLFVWFG